MDATTFFGFVLTAVIGFTFMALLLTFLDSERPPARHEERAHIPEGVRAAASSPALVPAFFAKPLESPVASATQAFDDDLSAFLQQHVRTEQALAAEFVHLPSIDTLYRQARPPLTMH